MSTTDESRVFQARWAIPALGIGAGETMVLDPDGRLRIVRTITDRAGALLVEEHANCLVELGESQPGRGLSVLRGGAQ